MYSSYDERTLVAQNGGPVAAKNELVLIGGASSASTILIRLAEEVRLRGLPQGGLAIRCFDRNGAGNGGIAYGGASEHHILNSVRTEMSPWRVDAFHDYCVERGLGSCRNDFNKRKDYAAFLKESVDEAVFFLRGAGVRFTHSPHDVSIEQCADGAFNLRDGADGRVLLSNVAARQIVLAVGYGPNNNFGHLRGEQGYIHSLYDAGARQIAHIKDGADIVFVGRGPALYDFANDLKGAGITNVRLTVIARSGSGPLGVRDVSIEAGETSRVPDFITSGSCGCVSDLRQAITAEFAAASSPRRAALDILRHVAPVLKTFDSAEVGEFQRSPTMDFLRHAATPVPLSSHVTLAAFNPVFVQAGIGGGDITVAQDGFTVDLGRDHVLHADYVVNGTGHGRHNAPVLEQLKKDGLARVSSVLGVLETDQSGYRLAGSGIACIGPAIHAGCDGVESFDVYAKALVGDLWERASDLRPSFPYPQPSRSQRGMPTRQGAKIRSLHA